MGATPKELKASAVLGVLYCPDGDEWFDVMLRSRSTGKERPITPRDLDVLADQAIEAKHEKERKQKLEGARLRLQHYRETGRYE